MKKTSYKALNYKEVEDLGGCVESWHDNLGRDYDNHWTGADAWHHLAVALKSKYLGKVPYIKRVMYYRAGDGVAIVKIYRDTGTQIFQFID